MPIKAEVQGRAQSEQVKVKVTLEFQEAALAGIELVGRREVLLDSLVVQEEKEGVQVLDVSFLELGKIVLAFGADHAILWLV